MKKMKNNEQLYSKAFYTKKVIIDAVNDYKKIARIKLFEDDEHYRCEFCNCVVAIQVVINEFNNYLIELMNSKGDSIAI